MSASAAASTASAQDKKLVVLGSLPGLKFPFFVHMMNEIQAEGKKLGVDILVGDGATAHFVNSSFSSARNCSTASRKRACARVVTSAVNSITADWFAETAFCPIGEL
jgi:ABC-type sugar transport system substrate-binding protein